jgi:hypothetical protein
MAKNTGVLEPATCVDAVEARLSSVAIIRLGKKIRSMKVTYPPGTLCVRYGEDKKGSTRGCRYGDEATRAICGIKRSCGLRRNTSLYDTDYAEAGHPSSPYPDNAA